MQIGFKSRVNVSFKNNVLQFKKLPGHIFVELNCIKSGGPGHSRKYGQQLELHFKEISGILTIELERVKVLKNI